VTAWAPPAEGVIKVNVDAGWDAVAKHVAIGVLARDHRGRVFVAEWKFMSTCVAVLRRQRLWPVWRVFVF
jgi:hypothetical protein